MPKCTVVCVYVKSQQQNLLSVVAHHEISICSNVFALARRKLGSELDRSIKIVVQKRRKERKRREGLGEDSRLSAFGELGWRKGENRNTGELLTQREMKAKVGALEGKE